MVPLLAFLLFSGQPAAVSAPSANLVQDFRLAGEDGPRKAVINLQEIALAADGRFRVRVFWTSSANTAATFVSDTWFDCAAHSSRLEKVWMVNAAFEIVGDGVLNETNTPEAGSSADQAREFVCSSPEARLQRPYLGSDWRSALRVAQTRPG